MTELDVFLQGRHIAMLESTRKGARLAFDDDVQQGYLGQPLLSMSMPVKNRPYSEGLTNAWFENLLPEGERLDRLCRQIQCQTSDYVRILEQIGRECAGAVSIIGSLSEETAQGNAADTNPADTNSTVPLSKSQLKDRLINLLPYEIEEAKTTRVSLGGFQEKLLLSAMPQDVKTKNGFIKKARFQLPQGNVPSTHILKPQLTQKYPDLISSEAWAMTAASSAARCAKVALLNIEGAPLTLVVERFDREYRAISDSGFQVDETSKDKAGEHIETTLLHQEDCCQALGLSPLMKYATAKQPKGTDPSYKDIARLLTIYSTNAATELRELLAQVVVNLALGNVDAHAKNYSFLYRQLCSPMLSPMYDITPVQDLEPDAIHLSMRVNGRIIANDVGREDVIEEAASWGLPESVARQVLDETIERLSEGLGMAAELYPDMDAKYAPATEKRMERFLK